MGEIRVLCGMRRGSQTLSERDGWDQGVMWCSAGVSSPKARRSRLYLADSCRRWLAHPPSFKFVTQRASRLHVSRLPV
jgi:hypothetical protein